MKGTTPAQSMDEIMSGSTHAFKQEVHEATRNECVRTTTLNFIPDDFRGQSL